MSVPKEYRPREYDDALEMLEEMKKKVENGEIISVLILAEQVDGCMFGSTTHTQNVFAVAGYMMLWAMKRLGFQDTLENKLHD